MSDSGQARQAERAWINDKLDFMDAELQGCDWCCGGGDEIASRLYKRLKELGFEREPGKYGWHGYAEDKKK